MLRAAIVRTGPARFTSGWRARLLPFTVFMTVLLAGCAHLPGVPARPPEFWAFAAPWDPRSAESARKNSASLDAVITGWIALDSASFRPVALYPDTMTVSLPATKFAVVTSFQGDRFHPEIVRGLAGDSAALGASANALRLQIQGGSYRGVVLDLEGMTPRDLDVLLMVGRTLADSARAGGAEMIAVAVPAGDTAGYPGGLLASFADAIVVMLYDEHWNGSAPGPVTSPDLARRNLGTRAAEIGAARIVAALPAYGYRWRPNAPAEIVGYSESESLAAATNTPLVRDEASSTLHARSRQGWEIWVSDRELLDVLVRDAREIGIRRFAIWRLGLEDPSIWGSTVPH